MSPGWSSIWRRRVVVRMGEAFPGPSGPTAPTGADCSTFLPACQFIPLRISIPHRCKDYPQILPRHPDTDGASHDLARASARSLAGTTYATSGSPGGSSFLPLNFFSRGDQHEARADCSGGGTRDGRDGRNLRLG